MQRRDVLRQSGATLAVATTVGLAGCGGAESSGSETETLDLPQESMGEVVGDGVDGLEVVGWESEPTEEGLELTITVRNVGDQTTDIKDYSYDVTVYDGEDTDITGSDTGTSSVDTEIDPGSVASITVTQGVDGNAANVARYEIDLNCDGAFTDGVYCQ